MTQALGVTEDSVAEVGARIGFKVPEGHLSDYAALLSKTGQTCELILSQEDYKPIPSPAYPRTNIHLPKPEANPLRAWSWRGEAGDELTSTGKLLSGKTVVLKDTVCMAEVPLRFGTDAFEGYIPDVDATVVTRILEHGGRLLGKASCENFSHGATSSSSPFGPVENPYGKGFTTGGSSSGCGGLVGCGEVDMAIGGDQGGSIRIPASYCGIVGLKPTFGLVPYTGVLSSDSGIDHIGPMARTVLDTAALLLATAGYDNIDDRQLGAPMPADVPKYVDTILQTRGESLVGKKIGILKEAMEMKVVTPEVASLVKQAAKRLEGLGATVEEVSAPTFSLVPALSHIINKCASGGTRLGRQVGRKGLYLNDYWDHLLPWDQDKYDKAKYFVTGTAMSAEYAWVAYPTAYGRAMNLSRKLRDELDKLLETYEAIIMPTCPTPPRRHIPIGAGPLLWAEHAPGASSITAGANLTGHPALTIPVGFAPPMVEDILEEADKDITLPIGLSFWGRYFDEATILALADKLESTIDWKKVRV